MDALIVDLVRRAEESIHRAIGDLDSRLMDHCNDPNAHPGHSHALDLSAVREAVDTALEEVARAVEAESPEDDTSESQGEGEDTPPTPPPPETEKPPERTHTMHRRVG